MKITKAHAIRFSETGGPEVLEWESVSLPPPSAGEATVRHHAVGLNFIDTYYRSGLYPTALPSGLGGEAAGVVEDIAADVTHFKIGDRVAYCLGPLGAYAEARNLPAYFLVKLPDAIPFDTAAAVMLKGLTVQYLFRQTYVPARGETILFHAAAGGVGLIACQWARALGVKLIGTVSSPEKAAIAKANGAWETVDYSEEDVARRVSELTDGKKVAVVYDGVGRQTWEDSLDCLKPRGLMVSFGNSSGAVTGVDLGILSRKGALYVTRPTLSVYVESREKLEAMSAELFARVAGGDIKMENLGRYALKDAARAQADLVARKTVGANILLP